MQPVIAGPAVDQARYVTISVLLETCTMSCQPSVLFRIIIIPNLSARGAGLTSETVEEISEPHRLG